MPDLEYFKQGRKLFRRMNKSAADEVRLLFRPLEPLIPDSATVEIPDGFEPHGGADRVGRWQLDFLQRQGLRPGHTLLDIGCGDLRGGVPLIRYLEPGRYAGVDQTDLAIIQGSLSLSDDDWRREPAFYSGGDFGFDRIGRAFDFCWAHSVFTHIDLSMVAKCMASAFSFLNPGGVFLASYFRPAHPDPWAMPGAYRTAKNGEVIKPTYSYRNPYHHKAAALEWIARDVGFIVDPIDEKTPKRQSIVRMVRSAQA